jgi:hypothetical protein
MDEKLANGAFKTQNVTTQSIEKFVVKLKIFSISGGVRVEFGLMKNINV